MCRKILGVLTFLLQLLYELTCMNATWCNMGKKKKKTIKQQNLIGKFNYLVVNIVSIMWIITPICKEFVKEKM
jgi:uncharacterized membrane protein YuzA (DUF378 family)